MTIEERDLMILFGVYYCRGAGYLLYCINGFNQEIRGREEREIDSQVLDRTSKQTCR